MNADDRSAAPFDDGLQPERTALAWRRTGLALLGGSLLAARILSALLPMWTLVPAGLGIAGAVGVLITAHLRYRRVHLALTSSAGTGGSLLHGGGLNFAVAALTTAVGVGALVVAVAAFRHPW